MFLTINSASFFDVDLRVLVLILRFFVLADSQKGFFLEIFVFRFGNPLDITRGAHLSGWRSQIDFATLSFGGGTPLKPKIVKDKPKVFLGDETFFDIPVVIS